MSDFTDDLDAWIHYQEDTSMTPEKIPDARLECIAKGIEDYDTEDVISMAAELWALRGEIENLLQELTDIRPIARAALVQS